MDHSTDMIPGRTRVSVLAAPLAAAVLAVTLWPAPSDAATLRVDRRDNRTNVDDEPEAINIEDCEGDETWYFEYTLTSTPPSGATVSAWIGTSCETTTNRSGTTQTCYEVYSGLSAVDRSGTFTLNAPTIVSAEEPGCGGDDGLEGDSKIWLLVINSDAEESIAESTTLSPDVHYDTKRPPAPASVTAGFGDTRAFIDWTMSSSTATVDQYAFRVLCDPNSGAPAADADADGDAADTDVEAGADAAADAAGDAGGCSGAGAFAAGDVPDPDYYCAGPLVGATVRSTEIDGLTNGTQYHFGVVALDEARNPSLVSTVTCTTPEIVDDFWDTYTGAGGQAEGGCACAAAAGPGAAGGLGLAALALLLTSLRRKRRSEPREGARGKAGVAE